MSAVQHTPGPWNTSCCDVPANECEPGDDGLRFWNVVCENYGDDFRGNIATVHAAQFLDHGKGISVTERDANARLIAAAPDLLVALKSFCDADAAYYGPQIRVDCDSHGDALKRMRVAREAIARAEGRS